MKKLLATTALIAALAANVAYAEPAKGKWHEMREAKIEQTISKFSPEKQELIRGALKDMREGRKENRDEMRKISEEIKTTLTAPTFNKDAYLKAQAKLDAFFKAQSDKRAAIVADVAGKLSLEERKALVELMPKGGHHGKKSKGNNVTAPEAQ